MLPPTRVITIGALCHLTSGAQRDPVLSGIDVSVLGIDVFGTCVEQLHWTVTEQNQSSCTMASILWLDVQTLYCSDRFSEADSGKSGRRASVLQVCAFSLLAPGGFDAPVLIKICGV